MISSGRYSSFVNKEPSAVNLALMALKNIHRNGLRKCRVEGRLEDISMVAESSILGDTQEGDDNMTST
jgi:hypothetical protein